MKPYLLYSDAIAKALLSDAQRMAAVLARFHSGDCPSAGEAAASLLRLQCEFSQVVDKEGA